MFISLAEERFFDISHGRIIDDVTGKPSHPASLKALAHIFFLPPANQTRLSRAKTVLHFFLVDSSVICSTILRVGGNDRSVTPG